MDTFMNDLFIECEAFDIQLMELNASTRYASRMNEIAHIYKESTDKNYAKQTADAIITFAKSIVEKIRNLIDSLISKFRAKLASMEVKKKLKDAIAFYAAKKARLTSGNETFCFNMNKYKKEAKKFIDQSTKLIASIPNPSSCDTETYNKKCDEIIERYDKLIDGWIDINATSVPHKENAFWMKSNVMTALRQSEHLGDDMEEFNRQLTRQITDAIEKSSKDQAKSMNESKMISTYNRVISKISTSCNDTTKKGLGYVISGIGVVLQAFGSVSIGTDIAANVAIYGKPVIKGTIKNTAVSGAKIAAGAVLKNVGADIANA